MNHILRPFHGLRNLFNHIPRVPVGHPWLYAFALIRGLKNSYARIGGLKNGCANGSHIRVKSTLNKKPIAPLSAVLLIAVCESTAFAHGGKPHNWHDLVRTWSWEPLVLISLALSSGLYLVGLKKLWREAAPGRGIRKWEAASFAGGWFALFIALVSPLHPWGRVLFSAHMTQHEVLMLVAAPLFVLSRPLVAFMWALPLAWARSIGSVGKNTAVQQTWKLLTIPFVAWGVHAIALWVWHIPSLFDATVSNELVHTFQHLSFFLSALLFWWALINGPKGLMGYGAATLYMFTTSLHSGLLGALITFASSVWYPAYLNTTQTWGLTPLEDQQLGGLIMWIPAGVVYIAAGLALFVGWLRESERRVVKREAQLLARQG